LQISLQNQFTPHDICDYGHKQQVEASGHALLATVDEDTPVKFQSCDISKEIQSLKLGNACGFDNISDVSGTLQEEILFI
jgi:hypothetical protein